MLRERLGPKVICIALTLSGVSGLCGDAYGAPAHDAPVVSSVQRQKVLEHAQAILQSGEAVRKARKALRAADLHSDVKLTMPTPAPVDIVALLRRFQMAGSGVLTRPMRSNAQLIVFVSASIPDASLRRLVSDAGVHGARLVFRGLVGYGMRSMAAFMHKLLKGGGNRARVSIDPVLFKQFRITRVPTFVLVPAGKCPSDRLHCQEAVASAVSIAGDVSLEYALEHIERTHPELRATLGELTEVGGE